MTHPADAPAEGFARRRPHGMVRMRGRDPRERHRAATPLELFFDLTFVVAFSIAGSQLAHALALGHVGTGLLGFLVAMFGITWCWINYSWFASAYDTDDWLMRLLTLLQMVGVVIFGLGLPAMFHGLEEGHQEFRAMVAGYVLMRVAMVALWVRVMRADPGRAPAARRYAASLTVAQVGWVLFAFLHWPALVAVAIFVALLVVELGGAYLAERAAGTPWHAHHIAERYNLLAIITLGEVVLGTTTAIEAVVAEQGWSVEAVVIAAAGISLAAGMWWAYFALPHGEVLHRARHRSFGWGYSHILLFASVAAVGSGLHVAAYEVAGEATISPPAVILTLAVPLVVFLVWVFGIYTYVFTSLDAFHLLLTVVMVALLAAAVGLAAGGTGLAWCVAVVMLVPWVTVVGYETLGHRHIAEQLDRLG